MSASANPDIVEDDLILCLDAGDPKSYSGSGTTWYDRSGNDHHFQLYNGVSYNGDSLECDGVNDYIRSINNIDFTSYDYVVVDVIFKVTSSSSTSQVFEHSSNWNSNDGAFGLFTNSSGYGYSQNQNHTNHKNAKTANYTITYTNGDWVNHINLFSKISDSTGRQVWVNNQSLDFSGNTHFNTNKTTAAGKSFRSDIMYLGSRGGSGSFTNIAYKSFKIYGRKFSDEEVLQNYNATKSRFGL